MTAPLPQDDDPKPSPTLAVCLDLWGQVVAYRAGCLAQPRWHRPALRNMAKALERGSDNHRGLSLTGYALAQDWHKLTRGVKEYPKRCELSPWVKQILAEQPEVESTDYRGLEVLGSHPGEMRSAEASYLTMTGLLAGGHGRRAAPPMVRSLFCWLYAVPHFADMATNVEGWCYLRYGGIRGDVMADRIESHERDLKRWVSVFNGKVKG